MRDNGEGDVIYLSSTGVRWWSFMIGEAPVADAKACLLLRHERAPDPVVTMFGRRCHCHPST